ncbi:Dyp-type peroxidase YfeX-like protein [Elysia marginata]|uniref:Dyp-type peroxidase YfeX-like protein n=1 Tax=Elysia marginata TaxID=1093978 RepID=A0AAV4HR16_9GAST|nr:Dyp-type peroxidase YfeX-like protein [Elysia marginata]
MTAFILTIVLLVTYSNAAVLPASSSSGSSGALSGALSGVLSGNKKPTLDLASLAAVAAVVGGSGSDSSGSSADSISSAQDKISDAVSSAQDAISDVLDSAQDAASTVLDKVEDAADAAKDAAIITVDTDSPAVTDVMADVIDDMQDAITDVVDGPEDTATETSDDTQETVTDSVDDTQDTDSVDDTQETDSVDDTQETDSIDDTQENVTEDDNDNDDGDDAGNTTDVIDDMTDAVEDATDAMTDAVEDATDAITDAIEDMQDATTGSASSAQDKTEDFLDQVSDMMTTDSAGSTDDFTEMMKDLLTGSTTDALDSVTDSVDDQRSSGLTESTISDLLDEMADNMVDSGSLSSDDDDDSSSGSWLSKWSRVKQLMDILEARFAESQASKTAIFVFFWQFRFAQNLCEVRKEPDLSKSIDLAALQMACRLPRCVLQRLLARTVTKEKRTPSFITARTFHRDSHTYKSRTNLTGSALGVSLALAGGAWYFRRRAQDVTSDFMTVRASTAAAPCGDKNMPFRSQIGKDSTKSRPKVPGPCNQKKKKSRCAEPQANVITGMKKYSLFLWITLEPDADPCTVACAAAQIDEAIAATKGFDCDVDDEVLAGVGFGPNFLSQNCLSPNKSFCYRSRKGKRGEMPSSNGDIFVHAKADSMGQLFDFCKTYLKNFPDDSVSEFEDLYGFSFRGTRDISGFLMNQTNRCTEAGLRDVALECDTGGSYAIAQKWVHDLCALEEEQATLECYVGRKMDNREEVPDRTATSHLTRMTGSKEPCAEPKYEIVQQCMSYGTLSERAGVFIMGFSKDPCVFDWMLDRMVGADCEDNEHDDVMRLSKNVKGTYWYFPGIKEIEQMKGGGSSS